MTRAPTPAAIHAAELRVAQSRRDIGDSLRRAHGAFRANLARPSTLALVAGAAGVLAFWMGRRTLPRPAPSSAGVARTASTASLVRALILRYGIRYLPLILRRFGAALKQRAEQDAPDESRSSTAGRPATATLH